MYPSQGRTGDNCLLATKVAVPVHGMERTGVGLLGSASFEIPRTVARDARLRHDADASQFGRRLAAKNRHNLVTIALYLVVRWFAILLFTLLGAAALDLYSSWDAPAVTLTDAVLLAMNAAYWVLVER